MRRAESAPVGPVLLATLVLLTACGGEQEPEELVAVPYPEDAVDEAVDALEEHVVPESAADALQEASPDPQDEGPELELETTGPPIAATREFVAERDEQARVSDHLLADLTGDGASEVLVATVDEDDEAVVEVARWEGDAFTTTARLPVGPPTTSGACGSPTSASAPRGCWCWPCSTRAPPGWRCGTPTGRAGCSPRTSARSTRRCGCAPRWDSSCG
jgi:hypothetical protein